MPTIDRRPSLALPIIAAASAILLRLPFLLNGEAFFNSDEAVEGLMARHLGELPVFFWGQGYKGVPEVYLSGAVFAVFGSGVIQLKSVTLAIWGVSVGMVVRLAQRWHGTRVAGTAAVLFVLGPPALVPWSLSGNAEIAVLSGIIAAMLIDYQQVVDRPGTGLPARIFFWCGLALWIHPVAACALAALGALVFLRSRLWQQQGWAGIADVLLARRRPPAWRAGMLLLHGTLAVLVLMFLYTFLGGTVHLGPIRATHPQRSLRAVGGLFGLAVIAHALEGTLAPRRRALAAFAWFAAGLAPILFQAIRGGGIGTSVITRRIEDMPWIVHGMTTDVLPLVVGLRDADGAPLGLPWWSAAGLVIALGVHLVVVGRECATAIGRTRIPQPMLLFPTFAVVAVCGLLTVGGGYSGSASIRYLLPFFGLIAIMAADGFARIAAWSRIAAVILLVSCLGSFGIGQYRWHERLQSDPSAAALIECLEQQDRRFARADYWIAYRLTFLAKERILAVPLDPAEDRYTPYRRAVDAASSVALIESTATGSEIDQRGTSAPTKSILCQSPTLRAVVPTGR